MAIEVAATMPKKMGKVRDQRKREVWTSVFVDGKGRKKGSVGNFHGKELNWKQETQNTEKRLRDTGRTYQEVHDQLASPSTDHRQAWVPM